MFSYLDPPISSTFTDGAYSEPRGFPSTQRFRFLAPKTHTLNGLGPEPSNVSTRRVLRQPESWDLEKDSVRSEGALRANYPNIMV